MKKDLFDIDPLKVFNMWIIFNPSRKYKLVETIDLSVEFPVADFKELLKHNKVMGSFILVQEIGRKILDKVKEMGIDGEFDAVVWCHVCYLPGDSKVTFSLDCFKRKRMWGN